MRPITESDVMRFSQRNGYGIDDDDIAEYVALLDAMTGVVQDFEAIARDMDSPDLAANASRDLGRLPSSEEDPLNAIARWCDVHIPGATGTLTGKRYGVKDNIQVASVPMEAGVHVLDGFVPQADASVVKRLLEAGAQIVAKLNLDGLAWSGGGETSKLGPILNPFDPTRTAGGSSGGSAASLFYDEIDVSIGGDQGGSIRLPASWCGVIGLKPTWGLVPYTGAMSIEFSCDYLGPLARTVDDIAVTMDVISGPDGWDGRQSGWNGVELGFREAVSKAGSDLSGTRIGVVREGFAFADMPGAREGAQETVDAVRQALDRMADLGATLVDVSVPEHVVGGAMVFPILMQQVAGNIAHVPVRYEPDLSIALGRGLRTDADTLPPTVKFVTMLGDYLREEHYGWHYGVAKNLVPRLRNAYSNVLDDVDFLAMPTTGHYAHRSEPEASVSEQVLRGISMVVNTGQFDITGHPAISIPAAEADGLPVGVMLVGRHLDDAKLVAAAQVYESAIGWQPA
jgi:amidase